MLGALVGAYNKLIVCSFFEGGDGFTQRKARLEDRYLLHQLGYKLTRVNDRVARNIIDGLLWIYLD